MVWIDRVGVMARLPDWVSSWGGAVGGWYLPASWELYELYKNMNVINQVLLQDKDDLTQPIAKEYYWSSTEGSTGSAWRQNFADGNQKYYYHKYSKSRLRAIRRF